jgi:hypothetical protein
VIRESSNKELGSIINEVRNLRIDEKDMAG